MARRNVTITLSEEALRRAPKLAEEKGISLSQLLSESLEDIALQEESYADAKDGLSLESGEASTWV